MSAAIAPTGKGQYFHQAVFYRGVDDLVEQMVPYIRTGLRGREAVVVVLTADKVARLRGALGRDGSRVHFADMMAVGRNPATIIPAWRDFLDSNPGRPVRGIGEPIFAARRPDELLEAQRHEALLNVAFESVDTDFQLLCPYDLETLPEPVLESARHNHPLLGHDDLRQPCHEYPGDHGVLTAFIDELAPPPAQAVATAFNGASLELVRRLLTRVLSAAALPPDRAADFLLAASELAANAVRHGGGSGVARAWRASDGVYCEVEDGGTIGDPLVGRRRPVLTAEGGRGLWLVNHVCDLVQVRSTPGRTLVRILLRS